jgi:hypothetical protein
MTRKIANTSKKLPFANYAVVFGRECLNADDGKNQLTHGGSIGVASFIVFQRVVPTISDTAFAASVCLDKRFLMAISSASWAYREENNSRKIAVRVALIRLFC